MLIDLMELPREGIYLVYDETGKRVYVNYSLNMVGVLPRLYEDLKGSGTTQFYILEVTTDIETLKLHTEYWRDEYKKMGCAELIPVGRKTLQYDVRCLVNGDYDGVDVVLVTARGDRKIVGKFGTMGEGESFIETYYDSGNPYNLPVYAINSATKEFLSERGLNIITI